MERWRENAWICPFEDEWVWPMRPKCEKAGSWPGKVAVSTIRGNVLATFFIIQKRELTDLIKSVSSFLFWFLYDFSHLVFSQVFEALQGIPLWPNRIIHTLLPNCKFQWPLYTVQLFRKELQAAERLWFEEYNQTLFALSLHIYQRSELDWLIYNDPAAYADLILNGDPETYQKTVTEYKPLD